MKKLFFVASMMLMATIASAQTGKSIYNKYSDEADVSAVFISPAMFRLIGNIPDLPIKDTDVNISSVIKNLSGFYLISSENRQVNASLRKDVARMLDDGKFELLMETKDNGEIMRMYTVGDKETVTNFVMMVTEDDECVFLTLEGKMSRDELDKILSSAMEE